MGNIQEDKLPDRSKCSPSRHFRILPGLGKILKFCLVLTSGYCCINLLGVSIVNERETEQAVQNYKEGTWELCPNFQLLSFRNFISKLEHL
jgi:hypothetical protein